MEERDDSAAAPLPPLRRDVEAVPVEHEGRSMFLISDPEGLSPRAMALSPAAMLIASLLDGKRTAAELAALFAKSAGAPMEASKIADIARQLEESYLLDSPEVLAKKRSMLAEFAANPVRKAIIAGTGYPKELLELSSLLGGFFRAAKGPGKPPAEKPSRTAAPLGLAAPHIDLQRGGPAYAWAYGELSEAPPPDAIVALGVAHASPDSPWTLTRKSYDTPHGAMAVDEELYKAAAAELWYDPLADEWVHRKEHSLEFQALWLKHLWREKTPPWLPILCSSFERFCPDKPPSSVPTVEKALSGIGRRIAGMAKNRRIMILAGVDLAHVGPRFGDDIELGPELEKRVEGEDRASLAHALALDADAFYLSVVAGGHWRKVCGLSALYTALRWIKALGGGGAEARLLAYGQAPDPLGGLVSFASLEFP
ncbi:MAG: AmmeMemoRadiSam system protein B [Elusimicrobia bacterium]|nr:AmmeMemoRadiSam system protein B [Elusimicrobiota bacterium]